MVEINSHELVTIWASVFMEESSGVHQFVKNGSWRIFIDAIVIET
jgi:hypothetical protein